MDISYDILIIVILLAINWRNQTTIGISLYVLRLVCSRWNKVIKESQLIRKEIEKAVGWKINDLAQSLDPLHYFSRTKDKYMSPQPDITFEGSVVTVNSTGNVFIMDSNIRSIQYCAVNSPILTGYTIVVNYEGIGKASEIIYPDGIRAIEHDVPVRLRSLLVHPTSRGIIHYSKVYEAWVNKDINFGEINVLYNMSKENPSTEVRVFCDCIIVNDKKVFSLDDKLLWESSYNIVILNHNFVLTNGHIRDIVTGLPLIYLELGTTIKIEGISKSVTGYSIHLKREEGKGIEKYIYTLLDGIIIHRKNNRNRNDNFTDHRSDKRINK